MDNILWITFCGSHFVDYILWITFCGSHFVDHILRITFCGSHFVDHILWVTFCGSIGSHFVSHCVFDNYAKGPKYDIGLNWLKYCMAHDCVTRKKLCCKMTLRQKGKSVQSHFV